jgi:hypothetical protein
VRAVAYILGSLALVITSGCAVDANSNTHGTPCNNGACPTNQTCYRGFCIALDGSTTDDGGADTGLDSAVDAARDASDVGLDTSPDADNRCDGGGAACTTGQLGECANGHRSCGAMQCVRNHDPIAETCNNHDDDCDGVVDEEADQECYPPSTTGCTQGTDGRWTCVGACRTGNQACLGGGNPGPCVADVVPNSEGCTAAGMTATDENCDGNVDEGCTCTMGMTRTCFDGPPMLAGIGRCLPGMQTCDAAGHWGDCIGSGAPFPESCANNMGTDDDCNGMVDDVPGIGSACTAMSAMGSCADGMTTCSMGSEACVGPMAATMEACDHHDDDCDGTTDEGFDLMTDNLNCGTCGNACGMGRSCCHGMCVDLSSDEMSCGMCTTSCSGATSLCCGSSCVDPQTDEMNCGGCGVACGAGRSCCGGMCVDPQSDEMNCGSCATEGGMACPATGNNMCCRGGCHASTDSECTCPVCTGTTSCCGSSCVDRMTDEANCGSCGHACTGSTPICCGGSCVASDATHCGGACTACGGTSPLCCGNTCVPTDVRHCTSCGMTCATGSDCCGDGCHDLASTDAHCGSCTNACTGATPHCTNSHCCAAGQTYCGTACRNLQSDNNNCGICGHACGGGYACCHGTCSLLALGCL